MIPPTGPWYRDSEARAFIWLRFVPLFAVLNLAWESVQLPLYTIWTAGTRSEIAFAVLHCTLGDVVIGVVVLALSLMLTRARGPADWQWSRVAVPLVYLGLGYTLVSELLNTNLDRWTYSELMPTLNLGGSEIGIAPLVQWILLPPLALRIALRAIPSSN